MSERPAPSREPRRATGWIRCVWWSICRHCGERIEVGQWQGLVVVPGQGRRWIHEACALALGATPREPDDTAPATSPPPPAASVRIVVIGSAAWPHDRAVEVRDGIEAVARGHREVVIVHDTRRDQHGRLCGVDAWAELTARRLGYTTEAHDTAADTVDQLRALRPAVVVAFPLETPGEVTTTVELTTPAPLGTTRPPGGGTPRSEPADIELLAAAAEHAGVPVLVHRPAPPTVATPTA